MSKKYLAKETLFMRGRPEGEYIQPGTPIELDDNRAAILLGKGAIEEVTAEKPAAKNQEAK